MKITDKIVTSKIQPQQTNVVWHNPETGELKMFGEKGWEVVGSGIETEEFESGTPGNLVMVGDNKTSLKGTDIKASALKNASQYFSLMPSLVGLNNILNYWNSYGSWNKESIENYISKGSTNMKYKNYEGNQMIKSNSSTTELYSPNGADKIIAIKDGEFKIAYAGQGSSPRYWALAVQQDRLTIKPYGTAEPCLNITDSRLELSAPDADDYQYCGISLQYDGGGLLMANLDLNFCTMMILYLGQILVKHS